jgi:TPR repeat protein
MLVEQFLRPVFYLTLLVLSGCGQSAAPGSNAAQEPTAAVKSITPTTTAAEQSQWLHSCRQALVSKDLTVAKKDCVKAAPLAGAEGQYLMGELYLQRDSATARKMAIEYYRKALAADYVEAQYRMAELLQQGTYIARDDLRAMELHSLACSQQWAESCKDLAVIAIGQYNFDEAHQLLEKAISFGSIRAYYHKGYMLESGKVGKANAKQAYVFYQKGAELGDSLSQYALYWFGYTGTVVEKDYQHAYTWWMLANEGDLKSAENWHRHTLTTNGRILKNMLSDDEVAIAVDEANQYRSAYSSVE